MPYFRRLMTACVLSGMLLPAPALRADPDSSTVRYFDQLRARGLFTLAEDYAAARLSDPMLSVDRRLELAIEWSRTLAAHAVHAADDAQSPLWQRAGEVLADELPRLRDPGQTLMMQTYAAMIPAARSEQLVFDLEAGPFEDAVREALSQSVDDASRQIRASMTALNEWIRSLEGKRLTQRPSLSITEARRLQTLLQMKLATVLQASARLSPPGSQDRHSDLIDADEQWRKVLSAADDELVTTAKLGLVISNRLRDEFERAIDMVNVLDKERSASAGPVLDAIRIERCRVHLAARQPESALQALLRMQSGRERLPGDYWFVTLQALSALRKAAAQNKGTKEVTEINDRAMAALAKVDEQAGGAWSRRCRAVWSLSESVAKYGPQLAAAMSSAKGEFLAGRSDNAIAAYQSAAELARDAGQPDVEFEIGQALASLLAKADRWEEVDEQCRSLAAAYPDHPQAAELNLWSLYAAGRLYDQDRTAERRNAYVSDLRRHRDQFADSPTISEVHFLQARLEETSGDFPAAMASYRQIATDHTRAAAAAAGIARCSVASLLQQRETGRHDPELERRLLEQIQAGVSRQPERPAEWSDAEVEQAYHVVKLLLLIEPPRYAEAERRLSQLDAALAASHNADETRVEIARRISPLRLITQAGQGRAPDSQVILKSLATGNVADHLATVEELSQIGIELR